MDFGKIILLFTINSYIVLDESLYTFRPVDKYFWMGTTRGTTGVSYDYPTEDGDHVNGFETYPNVTSVAGFLDDFDHNKDIFIFLHGFNVGLNSAIKTNQIIFRRMYWLGYRANYLGITWEGSYGPEGVWTKINFDKCVKQAFQSSRAINQFLSGLPKTKDVNIMAHSLGNLVMWDALRLEQYKESPTVLVFNVFSIQAAIWEDMFYPRSSISYSNEPDSANNVTYSIADLKRHSWAFWLNQGIKTASKSYGGIFFVIRRHITTMH